jgi:dTDP-4-amino-4,6-dideoxygalactose transaminase
MTEIKMVDLHGQYLKIKDEVDQAIQEVIDTSAFINGKHVGDFGNELAEYVGTKYVIPCANGTDALQIAYQALGLVPGDEVIIPTFNYVAAAEAAALLGIFPVFVDVNKDTFNMDENLIENMITINTKAIVVVHLFGQSANMRPIIEIARKNGLYVIEDNAQSLGSTYTFPDGAIKRTGSIGDINTHSFFPTKNLGCFGDGGAISTNNEELARKALMISRHGQGQKYAYEMIGCNSRLDTLQAAILRVKLRNLDSYLENRVAAGNYYNQLLNGNEGIIFPKEDKSAYHTFNQYVIRIENRDLVKEKLKVAGIPTMVYYPSPLHLQKAYVTYRDHTVKYTVSEKLCNEVLALPIHTEITTEQQELIANTLIKIINLL